MSTHPPKIAQWIIRRLTQYEDRFSLDGDLTEMFQLKRQKGGTAKAVHWYWVQTVKNLFTYGHFLIEGQFAMFKKTLLTALRLIRRNKAHAFINIFGLSVGLACSFLILFFVRHETGYDAWRPDAHRLYRLVYHGHQAPADDQGQPIEWKSQLHPCQLGELIRDELPQVASGFRIRTRFQTVVQHQTSTFNEGRLVYADPELLPLMDIPMISGQRETALIRPNTVLLSQSMAHKYFAQASPLGRRIRLNGQEMEITGVVADAPVNTNVPYAFIASMSTLTSANPALVSDWGMQGFEIYLKLRHGTVPSKLAEQTTALYGGRSPNPRIRNTYALQAITSVHLDPDYRGGVDPRPLKVLALIGLLTLTVAAVNFINLMTARSSIRMREIGVRKVMGARRRQLVAQFLGEAIVTSLLALALALLFIVIVLPLFNTLTAMRLSLRQLLSPSTLAGATALALLTGILAGIYPAIMLSRLKPAAVLRGRTSLNVGTPQARRLLVIGQFAISTGLIISALVVSRQLNHMQESALGFNKTDKLIIPVNSGETPTLLAQAYTQEPWVTGCSFSSSIPGRLPSHGRIILPQTGARREELMNHLVVDLKFLDHYDIPLAAGEPFNRPAGQRGKGGVMLNETAARFLGFDPPSRAVGKRLATMYLSRNEEDAEEIIGVVKDFHYQGLQSAIEPLVMIQDSDRIAYMTLSVNTSSLSDALARIEAIWKTHHPDQAFEYDLLTDFFDRQYALQERQLKVVALIAMAAVVISCLGLFGLSSFMVARRTKEIGIRKALGASVASLIHQLSYQFIIWIALANALSWPITWFLMRRWLEQFAYRIQPAWWMFVAAGVLSLISALLTLIGQTARAATLNPVKTLRHE